MSETEHVHPHITLLIQETRERAILMAALQIMGATCIMGTRALYWGPWSSHALLFFGVGAIAMFMGLFFLFLGFEQAWNSRFLAFFFNTPLDKNPVEKADVIASLCYYMVIIDCVLCGILIIFSRGFFGSFYSPLLLGVASTSLALRLPTRYLIRLFIFALLVATASELIWQYRSFVQSIVKIDLDSFLPLERGSHHQNALLLTTIVTISLTVLGGKEHFFDHIPKIAIADAKDRLKTHAPASELYNGPIEKGIRLFARDARRSSRNPMLSCVHPLSTIIEQSIILMYPYDQHLLSNSDKRLKQSSERACANIVYLAFAAHWIDDFFDHKLIDRKPIFTETAAQILGKSRHLKRLRKAIIRRAGDTLFNLNCDVETRVDRALLRIILGGLIQHCESPMELRALMGRYVEVVCEGLVDEHCIQVYEDFLQNESAWVIAWGSAKNVLDLFDGCFNDVNAECSEAYSVLYTPILICHNMEQEAIAEKFSPTFIEKVFDVECLRNDEEKAVKQLGAALDVFEKFGVTLRDRQSPEVLKGRRRQLRALLDLYGQPLPKPIYDRYEQLYADESMWSLS